jgi:hypothetical protein
MGHSIILRALGLVVSIVLAISAIPARASTVHIGLTISYFAAIPGNPISPGPPEIIPSNFANTQLTGTPKFFSGDTLIPGNPIFGPLSVGQTFSSTFEPPDPCFGATACSIRFSFGGSAGNFLASGFPITTDFPSTAPDPALVWSIGTLDFSVPTPPQISGLGDDRPSQRKPNPTLSQIALDDNLCLFQAVEDFAIQQFIT